MSRPEPSVLSWIFEMGEARLLQFVEEVLANPKMTDAISTAIHRAAQTRGQVDRNLQALLTVLGVPTKSDYNKLLSKIEALQGSLVNLNIKLDRLVASREMPKRRSGARAGAKPRTAAAKSRAGGAAATRRRPTRSGLDVSGVGEHGVGEGDEPR